MVGLPGFEPGTSCTPSKRASQAAPQPECNSLAPRRKLTPDSRVRSSPRYHRHMERDGIRTCDFCGQRIPPMSKLSSRQDGKDLCLACQIRLAQIEKGLRH